MSKESRLVARLKAMAPLTALVSLRVWPLTVPQGQTLPSLVYELTSATWVNDSTGTSGARQYTFRLIVFAEAGASTAGYTAMVAVADAVIGDEARTSPTGLSGWTDDDGDVWHLDDMSDSLGELDLGQDVLRVYAREMNFSVWQ